MSNPFKEIIIIKKKNIPKGLDLRPPKKCHPPRHHPAGDADIFASHGIAHRQHVGVQVRYLFTELDGAESLGGWGRGGRGWGRNWGERSKVKSLGFHEVEVEALAMIALPLPRPPKKKFGLVKKNDECTSTYQMIPMHSVQLHTRLTGD